MSENNNEAAEVMDDEAVEESSEKSTTTVKLDKGNLYLTLESITEGQWAGYSFFVPEFKSLEGAISHLTEKSQNAKDGEEIILELVNSGMRSRMRSRANSKLVVPSKIDGKPTTVASKAAFIQTRREWLLDPVKRVLVTEEDAFSYVPGEREVDSISGLNRQIDNIQKTINNLKKEIIASAGNEEKIEKLKADARVHIAKCREIREVVRVKQSEIDNALDIGL